MSRSKPDPFDYDSKDSDDESAFRHALGDIYKKLEQRGVFPLPAELEIYIDLLFKDGATNEVERLKLFCRHELLSCLSTRGIALGAEGVTFEAAKDDTFRVTIHAAKALEEDIGLLINDLRPQLNLIAAETVDWGSGYHL